MIFEIHTVRTGETELSSCSLHLPLRPRPIGNVQSILIFYLWGFDWTNKKTICLTDGRYVLASGGLEDMCADLEFLQARDSQTNLDWGRTLCHDFILCALVLRARRIRCCQQPRLTGCSVFIPTNWRKRILLLLTAGQQRQVHRWPASCKLTSRLWKTLNWQIYLDRRASQTYPFITMRCLNRPLYNLLNFASLKLNKQTPNL